MRAFRRQYRSNFAAVPKARRDVTAFARTCGLLPSDVSDIALAVGEACNNAAEHGHVASGSFEVSCAYENGELTVEVTDQRQRLRSPGQRRLQRSGKPRPARLGHPHHAIAHGRYLLHDARFRHFRAIDEVRPARASGQRRIPRRRLCRAADRPRRRPRALESAAETRSRSAGSAPPALRPAEAADPRCPSGSYTCAPPRTPPCSCRPGARECVR